MEASSDIVGGGLQDNRMSFDQEVVASPTEAVCSG